MRAKFDQLADQLRRGQPRQQNLAGIDTDRAMFAGVIDFDRAVAEIVIRGLRMRLHGVECFNEPELSRQVGRVRAPLPAYESAFWL
jgi:hypothetical protein